MRKVKKKNRTKLSEPHYNGQIHLYNLLCKQELNRHFPLGMYCIALQKSHDDHLFIYSICNREKYDLSLLRIEIKPRLFPFLIENIIFTINH